MAGALLASGALFLAGTAPSEAQSVESIMGARERLQLTEEQVQQLDAIRREAVSARNTEMAEIAELRSQLEAGMIRRSQLMALMEDQQVARQARTEERRAGIDAILNEAQREQALELRRRGGQDRAGPGRRFGAYGPGPRRGFGPGADDGFAPGRGPGFRGGGPPPVGPDADPPAPPAG
jgi:hypothetical protein